MLSLFLDQSPSYQTAKGGTSSQSAPQRTGLFGSLFGLFTIPAPAYRGTHPPQSTSGGLWDSLFPPAPQYQRRSAVAVRTQEQEDSEQGSTTRVSVTFERDSEK